MLALQCPGVSEPGHRLRRNLSTPKGNCEGEIGAKCQSRAQKRYSVGEIHDKDTPGCIFLFWDSPILRFPLTIPSEVAQKDCLSAALRCPWLHGFLLLVPLIFHFFIYLYIPNFIYSEIYTVSSIFMLFC